MKKGLRITMQIILFILAHGILILSDVFPDKIFGFIVISLFVAFSAFFLWKNTHNDTLVKSIVIIACIEFLIVFGGQGEDMSEKLEYYFSNQTYWVLPSIIFLIILILFIKDILKRKAEKSKSNQDFKMK